MPANNAHTPSFRFRLRFRMAKRIDSTLQEITIGASGLLQPATLISGTKGQPLGQDNWLVIRSRGYPSSEVARENGQLLKDALLLAGAERWAGVDVGMDRATTSVAQFIKDRFVTEHGMMLRDDIFGLDVFEDVETCVLQAKVELSAPASPDQLLQSIRDLYPLAEFMDHRSRVSAQLINDALFPLTPETRLLILMTAIESLWERPKRSASIAALADAVSAYLSTMNANADDKEDVAKRINDIRVQSISRMCKDKITDLLGKDRAKEFENLYKARSGFAHDGKGRAMLRSEGDVAQRLAFDVLLAELRCRKNIDRD